MKSQNKSRSPVHWISDKTIAERYEIARSAVWAWTRAGKLPKPVKIGDNVTRWNSDEVEQHLSPTPTKPLS
mgnify:CR=1 FL=1